MRELNWGLCEEYLNSNQDHQELLWGELTKSHTISKELFLKLIECLILLQKNNMLNASNAELVIDCLQNSIDLLDAMSYLYAHQCLNYHMLEHLVAYARGSLQGNPRECAIFFGYLLFCYRWRKYRQNKQ